MSHHEAPLSLGVRDNGRALQEAFCQSEDVQLVPITLKETAGLLVFLNTLVDAKEVNQQIADIVTQIDLRYEAEVIRFSVIEDMRKRFLNGLPYAYVHTIQEATEKLLDGNVLLLLNGLEQGLSLGLASPKTRAVAEASTQTIIRGPKDSFVETLEVNQALIRQRMKNASLCFESFTIGSSTRTKVSMVYINGTAEQHIIEEVRNRLQDVYAAAVFDSGQIEEFITDKSMTLFPTTYNTERPDTLCFHLVEGKVALLVDGSPFALTVPTVFSDFFQVSEDYYQPFLMATFIRNIRYLAYFISLLLPGLYVALTTYHIELIPTPLLVSIIGQRENVPFPAIVELFLMEITFEILREAGVRMPRAVGQTVSIVGALVIGQAAVEAGVVSTVMIIVVSFTAIASFVSPIYSFSSSSRLMRFIVAIGAALLGLYGVLLVVVAMIIHLVSLRSFGVPYFAPIAPLISKDQRDVFLRLPAWALAAKNKTFHRRFHVNEEDTSTPVSDHAPQKEEKP